MTSRAVQQVLPRSKPVALDIPSIGVHTSLLSLGLHADGTIEVPSGTSYDEAGWYRFSPTPGSLGPAVILGTSARELEVLRCSSSWGFFDPATG